jgi:AcrR family transcriptional regulator
MLGVSSCGKGSMKKNGTAPDEKKSTKLSDFFEISTYFSPEGEFNEESLRITIRDTVGILKNELGKKRPDDVVEELSEYLSNITTYMLEKGFSGPALKVLNTAVDELENMGLHNIKISVAQLKRLLESSSHPHKQDDKMKSYSKMRMKIFNAAIEVFSKKGYHHATIDEIAALSGIGKGTVYRNFKSKEDLLDQLLIEKYKEIIDSMSQTFAKDADILEQIQEVIVNWVDFIEKNPVVYRLIQDQAITQNISGGKMFYDYFVTHLPLIKERIIAMNKDQKIKTTSFYTVYYGILGFIDGVAHKWFRNGMSYPLKREIPIILEVIFNGFVGERKTGKRFYIHPGDRD